MNTYKVTMTIDFEIQAPNEEEAQTISDNAYGKITENAYVPGVVDISFGDQDLREVPKIRCEACTPEEARVIEKRHIVANNKCCMCGKKFDRDNFEGYIL